MYFPITLETTADEIINQLSISFDVTIEEIYKKLLQKKELERNESEVFYAANPNPNIEDNNNIKELLSIPLEPDSYYFFPFKGIDKRLSFANNNQKKIEILYERITYLKQYRFLDFDTMNLMQTIYYDYTDGFSFPLKHYQTELLKSFKLKIEDKLKGLKEDFSKPRKTKTIIQTDLIERTLIPIIEEIAELIESIKIEKYCVEKLNELNAVYEPQTKINLVKWKGTPGEFGAIFDLLIDNGFIELIKDKKNMVRLLHSLFEIKNDKGEITNSDYLYKCFKDKIKSYPNGYLKIPLSDNYHNDK